jgi:uncharacterized protein YbjT (DUF2867 family)
MRIAIAGATGTVGRHILEAARDRGHEVVALSRSSGQDVSTGAGLVEAIAGADAVIDVTNVLTTSASKSRQFFTRATRNLLAAERSAGVGHHVSLSIVGIDGTDAGYYAGKLAQEREVSAGAVPWSIQRATQFHEFAGQVVQQATFGPVAVIPTMLIRPVAAREVAERLVEVAEAGPAGRLADLVGPADERLIDMVRRLHARDGVTARLFEVRLPGRYWRAAASGSLRGNAAESDLARTTFDQWLDGRVT